MSKCCNRYINKKHIVCDKEKAHILFFVRLFLKKFKMNEKSYAYQKHHHLLFIIYVIDKNFKVKKVSDWIKDI